MVLSLKRFVEKSIPFLLVGVIILLIFEFAADLHPFQVFIDAFDFIVILFFTLDLYFKRRHCNSWTYFVKNYWLEIIATIPFFWILRIPAEPSEALRVLGEGGKVLHPVAEAEQGGRLIKLPRELNLLKLEKSLKALRLLEMEEIREEKKRKGKKLKA
ncbi:TPA: hypothetical protein HA318_01360 [Candidatus Micrarchaeota archaeon]|nr:hypothetical protein [Candidatus Micrarchaeota archaeon]